MTKSSVPIVVFVLVVVAVLLWVVRDNHCGSETSTGLSFTCSTPSGPGGGGDEHHPPRPIIQIHPVP